MIPNKPSKKEYEKMGWTIKEMIDMNYKMETITFISGTYFLAKATTLFNIGVSMSGYLHLIIGVLLYYQMYKHTQSIKKWFSELYAKTFYKRRRR